MFYFKLYFILILDVKIIFNIIHNNDNNIIDDFFENNNDELMQSNKYNNNNNNHNDIIQVSNDENIEMFGFQPSK